MGNTFSSMRIIGFFLVFISCSGPNKKQTKYTLDFKRFTIEVPGKWTPVKMEGLDSYIGAIAAENNDTVYFDLGAYSNNLEEYVKITETDTTYFVAKNFEGSIVKGDSLSIDSLVRSKFEWINVDGYLGKIVYPKISEHGITGIYIDSLWMVGNVQIKFTLQGVDLTSQTESELLQSLRTLKFIRK